MLGTSDRDTNLCYNEGMSQDEAIAKLRQHDTDLRKMDVESLEYLASNAARVSLGHHPVGASCAIR